MPKIYRYHINVFFNKKILKTKYFYIHDRDSIVLHVTWNLFTEKNVTICFFYTRKIYHSDMISHLYYALFVSHKGQCSIFTKIITVYWVINVYVYTGGEGYAAGRERSREYLATGASAKYASRIRGGSTLFARQLYFLFANKCVPLKIIFNVHVMWSPRDGCEEGIFWQRCTGAMFFFPSSNMDARWTLYSARGEND